MNRGPLCAEPVIGMAYFLESVHLNSEDMSISQGLFRFISVGKLGFLLIIFWYVVRSKWSNARGNIISTGQDVFRNALLDWSPRLQLAMYSCDIQATGQSLCIILSDTFADTFYFNRAGEVLGKVYGVVAKRRGRIVSEEMKEGTAFFTIRALLPVVESFGFADGTFIKYYCSLSLADSFSMWNRNQNENFWSC